MKAIKEEFPNPVLATGRDDYIENCCFYTTFEENDITVGTEDIIVPIKYVLECKGLQKFVESGEAVVVVLVKSSAASYRKLFRFKDSSNEMEVKVPKFSVVTKMDVTGSVIAAQDIKAFICEGEFNELYFGAATFEIRKGDILATEDSRSIYVDDSELEKPISSIFSITENDEQDCATQPNMYGEKIEIFLKKDLYDLYWNFKDFNNGVLRRYVTSIIVFPVLVEAIAYIIGFYQKDGSDSDADLSGKRWFRTIVSKAERLGVDITAYRDSPVSLADRLLGGISLDAMKNFKDTFDTEMNSGEAQMIGGID